MKKPILLSLSVLIALVFLNKPKATAQSFQIVASFGTTHYWNVPAAIEYEIYDYYPYHNWVHVNRVVRGRRVFYNILLEQDGFFTELQFGRYSRILRVQHYVDYPLYNHYCSAHCGYHNAYYNSHRVVNNHYYYGGHNHFVYRAQPNYLRQPVRPYSVRYADKNYRHNSKRAVADNSRIITSARESRPTAVRSISSNRSSSYDDRGVRSNSSRNYSNNTNRTSSVNRSQASTVNRSEPVTRERTVTRTTTTTRKASSPSTVSRGASSNTRSTETARSSSTSSNSGRSVTSRAASSSSRSSGTASRNTSVRSSTSSKASSPSVSNSSRSSSSSRSASTSSRSGSSNSRGRGN